GVGEGGGGGWVAAVQEGGGQRPRAPHAVRTTGRVVIATPIRTRAPPISVVVRMRSPSIDHARRRPTTGWRFRKMAARLGPTVLTPSYHQTCAIAPRNAW